MKTRKAGIALSLLTLAIAGIQVWILMTCDEDFRRKSQELGTVFLSETIYALLARRFLSVVIIFVAATAFALVRRKSAAAASLICILFSILPFNSILRTLMPTMPDEPACIATESYMALATIGLAFGAAICTSISIFTASQSRRSL